MQERVPPRIYCLPATRAPIVAVFMRGPTRWSHVGRWDQNRNARIRKPQPGGSQLLCAESRGWAGGEFGVEQAVDGMRVGYWLEANGEIHLLDRLQWADWDAHGRLLVATRSGKLQIWNLRAGGWEVLFEEDLSACTPNPTPAPQWARQW
jgi:hypothetical protein